MRGTYQLVGLFDCALGGVDGGLAWLAGELGDLVEFLGEVGLNELQLGFIVAEALGADVRIEGVGHGGGCW